MPAFLKRDKAALKKNRHLHPPGFFFIVKINRLSLADNHDQV
jgi:hypothetical protein